ncbi:MAG: vWA domain-containing protein [Rhodanobacteraceae bacterium]
MNALRRTLAFIAAHRLAILLLAAVVVVPVFFMPRIVLPGSTYSYLFVIDVTESMNVRDVDARDPHASRLDRAKEAVIAALATLPCGSRAGLALFAGTDTVALFEPVEVCRHFPAVEQVIRNLDWRMAWDGDSRIEAGLVNAIREATNRHLDLVFVTDGDEAPHVEVPRLSDLLSLRGGIRGWIVGVGSAEPHPVPRLDADNRIVGYWSALDAAREGFHPNLVEVLGQGTSAADVEKSGVLDEVVEHRSALRAAYLSQLATAAGLGYATADSSDRIAQLASDATLRREENAERDVRAVFGLAAALLIVIDWMAGSGRRLFDTRRVRGSSRARPLRTRTNPLTGS